MAATPALNSRGAHHSMVIDLTRDVNELYGDGQRPPAVGLIEGSISNLDCRASSSAVHPPPNGNVSSYGGLRHSVDSFLAAQEALQTGKVNLPNSHSHLHASVSNVGWQSSAVVALTNGEGEAEEASGAAVDASSSSSDTAAAERGAAGGPDSSDDDDDTSEDYADEDYSSEDSDDEWSDTSSCSSDGGDYVSTYGERSRTNVEATSLWPASGVSRTYMGNSAYAMEASSLNASRRDKSPNERSRTKLAISTSALPSHMFRGPAATPLLKPSSGNRRRSSFTSRHGMGSSQTTTNDMSMPFLFTASGSFGAFPTPPDESELPMMEASSAALPQSAIFSDMGFSYSALGPAGGNGGGSNVGDRTMPPSRRTSVKGAACPTWTNSHMDTSILQQQHHQPPSAATSMMFSTVDGCNANNNVADPYLQGGLSSTKLGMEGTFPSSMMYLYARTPKSNVPAQSGGESRPQTPRGQKRADKHHDKADDRSSHSSGARSRSTSTSDVSGESSVPRLQRHSSAFKPGHAFGVVSMRMANATVIGATGPVGAVGQHPDGASPLDVRYASNVRVLRGDFDDVDVSLDSRDLARMGRKVTGTAPNGTTRSGSGVATTSGLSTASVQSIVPDVHHGGSSRGSTNGSTTTVVAASSTEESRRRLSGNAIINFFRGGAAQPGRSASSMTFSSAWGQGPTPTASQQTVVHGWKLLSFRETDDTPISNTENVPHNRTKRKKNKDKKKKGKKHGKRAEAQQAAERAELQQQQQQPRQSPQEEHDGEREEVGGSSRDHDDVARKVVDTMTEHNNEHDREHTGISSRENNPNTAASASPARPASATSSGKGHGRGPASAPTSAAGEQAAPTQHSPSKQSPQPPAAITPPPKDGKPRPSSAMNAPCQAGPHPQQLQPPTTHPQTVSALPPLPAPPLQGKMRSARLSLRSPSTATAGAHNSSAATPSAAAAVANAAKSAPTAKGVAGSHNTAAAKGVMEAARQRGSVEKLLQPPLTSPSATMRRTTVRAAEPKAKVMLTAPRRVTLGNADANAGGSGVRRFRPSAVPRSKTSATPTNARVTPGQHVGVARKPPHAPERLPPL